uniref:Uncharacterized protein n=1 Tax=Arundo donax TaxID=35708 RepID=A0A0A9CES4_ARUDO
MTNKSFLGKFNRTEPKKCNSIETGITAKFTTCECNKAFNTISKCCGFSFSYVWEIVPNNLFHGFKGQQNNTFPIISSSCSKNHKNTFPSRFYIVDTTQNHLGDTSNYKFPNF